MSGFPDASPIGSAYRTGTFAQSPKEPSIAIPAAGGGVVSIEARMGARIMRRTTPATPARDRVHSRPAEGTVFGGGPRPPFVKPFPLTSPFVRPSPSASPDTSPFVAPLPFVRPLTRPFVRPRRPFVRPLTRPFVRPRGAPRARAVRGGLRVWRP